jgi:hypothetical protein
LYSQSWYSKATNIRIRNVFLLFMEMHRFARYKDSPADFDPKKNGMECGVNGVERGESYKI